MDPQSSPYATRLALKLVAEAYGEACEVGGGQQPLPRGLGPDLLSPRCRLCLQRTCATLFAHGTQMLRELEARSKLGASDLRTALLVLIQHNCVECSLHQEPAAPHKPQLPVYLYRAATHRILQALRWGARELACLPASFHLGECGEGSFAALTAPRLDPLPCCCRAPRFLAHIRDEMAEELPEKVLQQLLYYGRQRCAKALPRRALPTCRLWLG